MRNIVDEAGETIAKASDDHTLLGGHHRLAVAASLGQKLFWKDTGEPVKLDVPTSREVLIAVQPDTRARLLPERRKASGVFISEKLTRWTA